MTSLAILMRGTVREAVFLTQLLPHITGNHDYDLFLCLRQTAGADKTRINLNEDLFDYTDLAPILGPRVYLQILPPFDPDFLDANVVTPVGPEPRDVERKWLTMFGGIFAGVQQIKNSFRHYDYVLSCRTDYLFPAGPVIDICLNRYVANGGRPLIEGQMTTGFRYQDKPGLPWQGSLSDLFTFSNYRQFLDLWDFGDDLPAIWTGITETTLFRHALKRFTGETVQHTRKNQSFIDRFFDIAWGDYAQSIYYFRHGVLTPDEKHWALARVREGLAPGQAVDLVWRLYRNAEAGRPLAPEALLEPAAPAPARTGT